MKITSRDDVAAKGLISRRLSVISSWLHSPERCSILMVTFCHCVGKSKLMSILESSLPDQRPDQEEEQRQHDGRSVVIIDAMTVV